MIILGERGGKGGGRGEGEHYLYLTHTLSGISKIALVIIENGTCWLVENFVLSRYNHC